MKLIPYTCPGCGTSLVISPAHPVFRCKSCGILLNPRDCLKGRDLRALAASGSEEPSSAPSRSRPLFEEIMAEERRGTGERPVRKPSSKDLTVSGRRYYSAERASVTGPETGRPAGPEGDPGKAPDPGRRTAGGASAGRTRKAAPGTKAGASYYTPVGFRTGNVMKMVFAVLGYLFLALIAAGSVTTSVFFLSMIPLWFNWAPLTDHLPFDRIRNTFLRVLAKLAFSLVWMVVLVMIAVQFDLS